VAAIVGALWLIGALTQPRGRLAKAAHQPYNAAIDA
jgi:hypothetical protein